MSTPESTPAQVRAAIQEAARADGVTEPVGVVGIECTDEDPDGEGEWWWYATLEIQGGARWFAQAPDWHLRGAEINWSAPVATEATS